MIALLFFTLAILAAPFKSNRRLAAENAALRQQLTMLRRQVRGRVRLTNNDRLFFVQLYRWFPSVLKVITVIRPETLVLIVETGSPPNYSAAFWNECLATDPTSIATRSMTRRRDWRDGCFRPKTAPPDRFPRFLLHKSFFRRCLAYAGPPSRLWRERFKRPVSFDTAGARLLSSTDPASRRRLANAIASFSTRRFPQLWGSISNLAKSAIQLRNDYC